MGEEANSIIQKIKEVDNNVNSIIVPLLKDTVEDYRKIVFKLIIVIVILIVSMLGIAITSQFVIAEQINKYNDFLSQFEYEGDISQNVNADDGGDATVNSGINVTK